MINTKQIIEARDSAVAYLKRVVEGEVFDHQQRFSAAMTILHSTCGCPCHQDGYDETPEEDNKPAT